MEMKIILWTVFNVFILAMLFLDLVVFQKKDHEIKMKEALLWSFIWIAIALLFNVGVYIFGGPDLGLKFLTGYLLEKSLSVDNLFVFLLIFSYFKVPGKYQHKILFWGILGAIITRALFIFGGIALIERFHWIIYILGVVLIISGIKLFDNKEKEINPEKNPMIRLCRTFIPVTCDLHEGNFFVKQAGRWMATPLFVVLVVVETTDIVFAVDSIPAILSISRDPFIVYSSNVFAILGLRALYFALAGLMKAFYYLHYGLGVILIFVGAKMLVESFFHVPVGFSLVFIGLTLSLSIVFSLMFPKKH